MGIDRNDHLPYLGVSYPAETTVTPERRSEPELSFTGQSFVMRTDDADSPRVRDAVKKWYSEKVLDYLPERIDYWKTETGATRSHSILISDPRGRWASTGADGTFRFNWRCIALPPDLIDYIVLHEVAHLKLHNHSKDYWAILENVMPDMKQRKNQVREYVTTLRDFLGY